MQKIICLVDNTALPGTDLRSEHGLSFLIDTGNGCVLFDSGQTESVLAHNLKCLGLDPRGVCALALSHAHYDHTGGLDAILSHNMGSTVYAHSDIFRQRYNIHNGETKSIGLQFTREALTNRAQWFLSEEPVEIFSGIWTTGEITGRTEPEGRSAHHFIRMDDVWQPDPYRDDQSLVWKTPGGLVVICGCCHAGLLNTLHHVSRMFTEPVMAVIGGTHLSSADDAGLAHVVEVLKDEYPEVQYYLNHCTGDRALQALRQAFGSRVHAFPAGTVLEFNH